MSSLSDLVRRVRSAPHVVRHRQLRALHLRVRRFAKHQAIISRPDVPIVAGSLVGGEQARIARQLDALALAGLEVGLGEGAEPLRRFPAGLPPVGRRYINLGDTPAGALADIADREADPD